MIQGTTIALGVAVLFALGNNLVLAAALALGAHPGVWCALLPVAMIGAAAHAPGEAPAVGA